MVFNKEEEIPHTAAGAEKGAVQHSIKTYCNVERGENSHSSRHANGHASVSTRSQLLSVCLFACVCVCALLNSCVIRRAAVWFICDIAPHYSAIGLVMK